MFTAGALVFVLSVLRVTVIRLKETPKYLLGRGEDAALVESLRSIAARYGRPCSLTAERLEACGRVQSADDAGGGGFSARQALVHLRGLFATRQLAVSTLLIWLSWTLIGLAYPLFYVFLKCVSPRFPSPSSSSHSPNPIHTNSPFSQRLPRDPGRHIGRQHVRHVAQLRADQRVGHLRAHPSGVAVRAAGARPAVHHVGRRARDHGLLFCVHGRPHARPERRLQLRHRLLPQHLLRHAVRVHARGPAGEFFFFSPLLLLASCFFKETDHGRTSRAPIALRATALLSPAIASWASSRPSSAPRPTRPRPRPSTCVPHSLWAWPLSAPRSHLSRMVVEAVEKGEFVDIAERRSDLY